MGLHESERFLAHDPQAGLEELVGNFARDPTDPAWFHLLVENLARVLTTADGAGCPGRRRARGRVVLALSADHGFSPLPEVVRRNAKAKRTGRRSVSAGAVSVRPVRLAKPCSSMKRYQ